MNTYEGGGCIVSWDEDAVTVQLRGRMDNLIHTWTDGALEWEGVGIAVLAARRLEWHVDLLIRRDAELHTVRIGPTRALSAQPVLHSPSTTSHGRAVRCGHGNVHGRATGEGFEVTTHDRVYTLAPTAIPGGYAESKSEKRLYDLFVSYKDMDTRPFATELVEVLEASGYRVWFAPHDIRGAIYPDQIAEAIAYSRGFIILWSRHTGSQTKQPLPLVNWTQHSEIQKIFATVGSRSSETPIFHYIADKGVKVDDKYIMQKYQVYWAPESDPKRPPTDFRDFVNIILDDLENRP